jgi:hypothetical protein
VNYLRMKNDSLRVSDGALVIASLSPVGADLSRGLKNNMVWSPKLLFAIPDKENPFIVSAGGIKLENTPYYVKKKDGYPCIWHVNEEIKKNLNLLGYSFIPGLVEAPQPLYVFSDAFVPDVKDSNQDRLNVGMYSNDDFSYSESGHSRLFVLNSRKTDLPNIIYNNCLPALVSSGFGYDCEHSGNVGLPSSLHGRFVTSEAQRSSAVGIIKEDLERKLGIDFRF